MRLEALFIDKFRSIDHVEIRDCGPFNVLIGKNNSGKSNILSAIEAFFKVIHEGQLVTINSPIAQIVDFHNQETASPVSVTVRFFLNDGTTSELLSNIVSDAPQMRNAVEALRTSTRLSVTVNFTPPPDCFAYISAITLGEGADPAPAGRILLRVEEQTATELYRRAARIDELEKDSRALTSIPERVPREWLRRSPEQRVPPRFLLGDAAREAMDPGFERLVDTLMRQSETAEDFIRAARTEAAKWDEEIAAIRNKPLGHPLNTFAGVDESIPNYISSLLRRLASAKILHLQERRKHIGREEAGGFWSSK